MTRLKILLTIYAIISVVMVSCKSKQTVMESNTDNMYFMASDVAPINQSNSFDFTQENFSSKSINPEYIARYQTEFNDVPEIESEPTVRVYDNYFVGFGQGFFSPMIGGFYPYSLAIYDPFWVGGWGFRHNMFIGSQFGFMNRWMAGSNIGFMNFYDPFYNPFFPVFRPAWDRFYFYNKQTTRGLRPTRGSSLSIHNRSQVNSLATPAGARSVARKNVLSNRTVNQDLPRTSTREDFRSSQNDYYNSAKPVTPSRRNAQTPAVNRESGRNSSQSVRPSYKATTPNINTSPSRRTASPSYNRTSPTRNTPTSSTPSRRSSSGVSNSVSRGRGN